MADEKKLTDEQTDALDGLAQGQRDEDDPSPPADGWEETEADEEHDPLAALAADAAGADETDDDDAFAALAQEAGAGEDDATAFFDMEDGLAGGGGAPRRRAAAAGVRARRPAAPTPLARHGVKACLAVGMLLLIPALWAVGVFAGLSVPKANAPGAKGMAALMLLCWPIGGALIWGAFHYAKQFAKFDASQTAGANKTAIDSDDDPQI